MKGNKCSNRKLYLTDYIGFTLLIYESYGVSFKNGYTALMPGKNCYMS